MTRFILTVAFDMETKDADELEKRFSVNAQAALAQLDINGQRSPPLIIWDRKEYSK